MRYDGVEDDGIGDEAKAWNFFQERFQDVQTTVVVTLVAQLAQLELKNSENLDSFY